MTRKKKLWVLIVVIIIGSIGVTGFHIKDQFGNLAPKKVRNVSYLGYNYYNEEKDEFLSPEEIVSYPDSTTGGNPGLLRFFVSSPNVPEIELPKESLTSKSFSSTPSDFAIYWLGHSSTIIELDGYRLLIDPVFENAGPFPFIARRISPSPLSREDLPEIDAVIITHDHYDHLETATIEYLADKETLFITPLAIGSRLQSWGVDQNKIRELGWGQQISLGSIEITATPSIHYSGRSKWDRNKTLWASYVIQRKRKKLFWSGDGGYGDHFKEIGAKYGPFNLAFVEIDAWNDGWPNTHLFPDEVIRVCQDINSKSLFPIHLATFDLAMHPWDESINMISSEIKKTDIDLVTPIMGMKTIPGQTKTQEWWKDYN